MQRFSSDLWTDLHFHLVSLDDALGTDAHGQRRFETAPSPSPDDAPESSDGQVRLPTQRKARLDGFDLHAEVCVEAHDRPRLEAPCRRARAEPPTSHRGRRCAPVARRAEEPSWGDGDEAQRRGYPLLLLVLVTSCDDSFSIRWLRARLHSIRTGLDATLR
jgi:hypothetical protein